MDKPKERFSRSGLRSSGIDISVWKAPDLRAFSTDKRELIERRLSALNAFLTQGATCREIEQNYSVPKSTLYDMIGKALQLGEDGHYVGYRACLLNFRLQKNFRTAELQPKAVGVDNLPGDAGLFSQLLRKYPKLETLLRRYAIIYKSRKSGGIKKLIDFHSDFLKECEKLEIRAPQYPFARSDRAVRSFERYLHNFKREYAENQRDRELGVDALAILPTTEPLQEVQLDGHNLDIRITVQETDTYGLKFVHEILTVWVILVIDVYTRCVLGYNLALGKNYDQTDLLTAIYNSIAPHVRPRSVIQGLTYKAQGGFPSEKISDLGWSCGIIYKLDNAMAHKAKFAEQTLRRVVGCFDDFGPPHAPNDRAIVETFFRYLVDNFSHRIIGTTGSQPKDEIIRRLAPKGGDLTILLTIEELHQALDIVISDYNGRPHKGIPPHSPLELFVRTVRERDAIFPRLRSEHRDIRHFTQKTDFTKVRSDGQYSAFINFKGARYRNLPVLSHSVGDEVMIEWDPLNISYLRVYDLQGRYLGEVFPPQPWVSPHSEKLRERLLKSLRNKQISYREGDSVADLIRALQQTENWKSRDVATYNLKHTGSVTLSVNSGGHVAPPSEPVERLTKGYIFSRRDKK
ncbi:Mu transposase C-terminal domain-containing protein [Pseudomonas sp. V98_8]|uniref:Mu transposase C-terminal domain-containing protein n=1 Tax=Pseudomonas sp. V98_8 TaxID=3044228 RepID=UPI00249ED0F6|nr:Mu transposase C-terminal domain-containing protein [Pseudomonas sp. V98_8]MDI3391191.1 Mu transposase C-terminal domain-containing protein [Pseudomonas sp. V98_8]